MLTFAGGKSSWSSAFHWLHCLYFPSVQCSTCLFLKTPQRHVSSLPFLNSIITKAHVCIVVFVSGSRSSSVASDSCSSYASSPSTSRLNHAFDDVSTAGDSDSETAVASEVSRRSHSARRNSATPVKPPPYSKSPPTYTDIYVIDAADSTEAASHPPPYTSDQLPRPVTSLRRSTSASTALEMRELNTHSQTPRTRDVTRCTSQSDSVAAENYLDQSTAGSSLALVGIARSSASRSQRLSLTLTAANEEVTV